MISLGDLQVCILCGGVFAGALYLNDHEREACPKRHVLAFNDRPHRPAPRTHEPVPDVF